ncbi:putative sporulation protein YtaF [Cytobacillus horneckiae]|uniref:Sporulation membrane protein YtaF n=1 Tax=Cytobacillus horneckiae TaxID=549687 RepID=A0A2N0ZMG1_9BACI|nr:sporulation membrane protein YtaF [Cytobacillus horneckiae]MBN6887960.1 sporulation membrane protein YtaF [Cytobacillus horneckiae]MCM3179629.1 sporulation membrane protein YtaF [Cytobacillus horneckiae]MEC1155074.1 sporulation membrane protein YtaF [Cytobacillus horneckiae]MED2936020.1 sporulation membrane protein YtaF [Cytobacillus horneckiae]PKG30702.1 sporulation membrane protein YtaF [Cytobacillus horneckiae]
MTQMIALLILAVAVSLDSFSVGLTYGLRKMKIPIKSILIIACCSAFTLLISMGIGHTIARFISPAFADSLGGIILIVLGAWVLYQFFRPEKVKEVLPHEKIIVNFEIKSLGLVINILRKPMAADIDKSGTITGIEAFLLGFALSLDAFGAGIGAAMLGYSPYYLAVSVAVMSSLFVFAGMRIGDVFSNVRWMQRCSFIPGLLLIIIGIWKI